MDLVHGVLALERAMNKLTTILCALTIVGLAASFDAQCATGKINSGNELLVSYGRIAVIEFCQKSDIQQCDEITSWIDGSKYELYSYGSGSVHQHMIIFTQAESIYAPFAIFMLDKDGWIKVITRGVHMGEKKKFIDTFKEEGDFAR